MIRSQEKAQPKTHQYQMKYRLTGAVVIVGFAIVVISALLNEPSIERNTRTNNAGSRQTFTLEIPLPNSGNDFGDQISLPSEDSAGGYDDNDTKPALLEPESVVTAEQISTTSTTKGEDAGENIVLSKDIAKNGSGWIVRVGTYLETENVDNVSALLNSHGFDARHDKAKTKLGVATRIWLGPYIQKETAEKVNIQIKRITGEKSYVTKTSS